MTLTEITFDENSEALLQDPKGKYYFLQNGGLWSGFSLGEFSNFVAEGAFDDNSETEGKLIWFN